MDSTLLLPRLLHEPTHAAPVILDKHAVFPASGGGINVLGGVIGLR